MLDAPEAAGGYGAFLGSFGHVLDCACAVGVEAHAGGGGEGAEEAIEEGGKGACHQDRDDRDDEGLRGDMQFGGVK